MEFSATFRLALRALARNKMRTALTMLGIIIGVGAVICAVGIGEGASRELQQQIDNLGDNMIWIEAGGRNLNGVRTGTGATKTLTVDDARAIEEQIPAVKNLSPNVDTAVQVVYGNLNWFTRVAGVAPPFLEVKRWKIAEGSPFFESDVTHAANVCLLGRTVADFLFGDEDPIGKTIRVKNIPCKVLAVLAPKGLSSFGSDQDDTIIMPFTTVQRKIKGIDWLDDIMCSAASPDVILMVQDQISALLRERHHLRPDEEDDFSIRNPQAFAQTRAGRGSTRCTGGQGSRTR